jgi:acetyl esterase/lipase
MTKFKASGIRKRMNTAIKRNFLMLAGCLLLTSCLFKPITSTKDLVYDKQSDLRLDVYSPPRKKEKADVMVFIHGGNWRSGKKSLYRFFGKGLARKNIVSVVIDYRLSNKTDYAGMCLDAAKAIKWTRENATTFGGDTSRIFISGHSSGGHISALVSTDPSYFKAVNISNPLRGIVLIDAFGLDISYYLTNSTNKGDSIYYPAFTKNQETWKKASPVFFLSKNTPPVLMMVGSKTYPAIKKDSEIFFTELRKYQTNALLIRVKGKRHVAMIGRFYKPRSKGYRDILAFIKSN